MKTSSIKNMANISISQLTGMPENTISNWKALLHTRIANWLISNPLPLGGLGSMVEIDDARFGKRKYNTGAYREGQWAHGGVDRYTGHCFLLPYPNHKRDALTLLPVITSSSNRHRSL